MCEESKALKYQVWACKYAFFRLQIKIFVIAASNDDHGIGELRAGLADEEIGFRPNTAHDTRGDGFARVSSDDIASPVGGVAKWELCGEGVEGAESHADTWGYGASAEVGIGSYEVISDGSSGVDDESSVVWVCRPSGYCACETVRAECARCGVVDGEGEAHVDGEDGRWQPAFLHEICHFCCAFGDAAKKASDGGVLPCEA